MQLARFVVTDWLMSWKGRVAVVQIGLLLGGWGNDVVLDEPFTLFVAMDHHKLEPGLGNSTINSYY